MTRRREHTIEKCVAPTTQLEGKLAVYLASASAASLAVASNANAIGSDPTVIATKTSIQFGPANGGPGNIDIAIDLDNDTETDYVLAHRSNSLGEDYLELDKSPDENSDFPDLLGDGNNGFSKYLEDAPGSYPNPLFEGDSSGTVISPPAGFSYGDWQDTSNFQDGGTTRRANRLIDYDSGVDDSAPWDPPPGNGNFLGNEGVDQYFAFQIEFDSSKPAVNYGWIGVRITDDATASGELFGYAVETTPLTPITMGVVPEPGTIALAAIGGITLTGSWITRKFRRS